MPEKHKDGYLIQFNGETASFPDRCPVCGRLATTEGTILTAVEKTRERLRDKWPKWSLKAPVGSISPAHWDGYRPGSGAVRKLRINTCEKHAYSAVERGRARSLFIVLGGLSTIASIFFAVRIGFLTIQGIPIESWSYALFALAIIVMIISYRALGPTELEKAIQIVSYRKEASSFTVRISNEEYAREFLRSNPHSAELIETQE
jgi:hypothetical protein